MRVCHTASAGFDDPNLVSCAGLIPVMRLAERAGLHDLARAHVRVPGSAGSNGLFVNAGRKLTPCCRLNFDPCHLPGHR